MNGNSLFSLGIEKASASAGYQLTDNDEIAVQQDLKFSEFAFGQFQIGYSRKINDKLESKLKIDSTGVWTFFSRYHLTSAVKIGASIQSNCFKLNGVCSQPVNFGLRITHNS